MMTNNKNAGNNQENRAKGVYLGVKLKTVKTCHMHKFDVMKVSCVHKLDLECLLGKILRKTIQIEPKEFSSLIGNILVDRALGGSSGQKLKF